jgi:hypothetical protein
MEVLNLLIFYYKMSIHQVSLVPYSGTLIFVIGGPDYRVVPWESRNGIVESDILLIDSGVDERSSLLWLVP